MPTPLSSWRLVAPPGYVRKDVRAIAGIDVGRSPDPFVRDGGLVRVVVIVDVDEGRVVGVAPDVGKALLQAPRSIRTLRCDDDGDPARGGRSVSSTSAVEGRGRLERGVVGVAGVRRVFRSQEAGDGSGHTARRVLHPVVGVVRVRGNVWDPARSKLVTVVRVDDHR